MRSPVGSPIGAAQERESTDKVGGSDAISGQEVGYIRK